MRNWFFFKTTFIDSGQKIDKLSGAKNFENFKMWKFENVTQKVLKIFNEIKTTRKKLMRTIRYIINYKSMSLRYKVNI